MKHQKTQPVTENKTMKERLIDNLGTGVIESMDPELVRSFDLADKEVPDRLKDPTKLQMKDGHIKVSGDGVFYTLQGEGPSMGEPTVFLRTHICNLRCTWCDTPYTWNPKSEGFWTEPEDWTVEDTAEKIKGAWGTSNPDVQKRIVITGGEPLIQQREIIPLIDELGEDWVVEIETNGTMMPDDELMDRVQFNVSPKLANSENTETARIRPDVIRKLAEGNTTFKFVVMQPEELDEIERDYIEGCEVPVQKVILMPQGVTADEVRMNAQHVAEYAKEKGYRLLGRLQNEIWGAKRGV